MSVAAGVAGSRVRTRVAAQVDVGIGNNGTFLARDVPLVLGVPTIIEATATDDLGNQTTTQITVTREEIPPDAPRMEVVSGNGQTAQIGTTLLQPIVVKVTHADGSPFPSKIVTFEVTRSNGRLTSNGVSGSLLFQVNTDANGDAAAFWKLGSDAGCGNNLPETLPVRS